MVCVKLQRIVSRNVGDKTYYKWQVTIPPEVVADLDWKEGQEIETDPRGNELRLRPAKSAPSSKR